MVRTIGMVVALAVVVAAVLGFVMVQVVGTVMAVAVVAVASTAAIAFQQTGFVPLFNGEDFTGWTQINGTATYWVEDGVIVGRTAEGSPNSFLCTEKMYGDFELYFEVKVDPRLNSGVQIRSESKPDYRNGRVHGYQVEISTNGNAGFIYDEARRGWLSTDEDRDNPEANAAFDPEGWNRYRVICQGESIKTFVNDVPCAVLTDTMTPSGFIGLQVHSFRGDPPAEVRWRNIWINELDEGEEPWLDSEADPFGEEADRP